MLSSKALLGAVRDGEKFQPSSCSSDARRVSASPRHLENTCYLRIHGSSGQVRTEFRLASSYRRGCGAFGPWSLAHVSQRPSLLAQRGDLAAGETVGADPTLSSGYQPAHRRAARCQHHAHRHAGCDAYVILTAPAGDLLIVVKRTAAPGSTLARFAVAGNDG